MIFFSGIANASPALVMVNDKVVGFSEL
jgi:hypothetical protein